MSIAVPGEMAILHWHKAEHCQYSCIHDKSTLPVNGISKLVKCPLNRHSFASIAITVQHTGKEFLNGLYRVVIELSWGLKQVHYEYTYELEHIFSSAIF